MFRAGASDAPDMFAAQLRDAVDAAVQDRVHRFGVEVPDDAVDATCSAGRQSPSGRSFPLGQTHAVTVLGPSYARTEGPQRF